MTEKDSITDGTEVESTGRSSKGFDLMAFVGLERGAGWKGNRFPIFWGTLRILMGWIFLWAFLDKTFGLGYATPSDNAWIRGGSPTTGYLTFAVAGPFADIYGNLAGNSFIDWVFMIGLLGIGYSLISGMGVRIGGYAGALMMLLFYTSNLPLANNPIIDDHIVYLVILLGFAHSRAGHMLGVGGWWSETRIVQKVPLLA